MIERLQVKKISEEMPDTGYILEEEWIYMNYIYKRNGFI